MPGYSARSMDGRPAWPVLLVYLLAFLGIVSFTIAAAVIVRSLYPELSEREVFEGLPGLIAGGVASSLALVVTLLAVLRPFDPARLRLRPGRETGRHLALAIVGTLALGQALDSLTVLIGLGDRGSMATIRRALGGAAGPDLFLAVLVIGVLAATVEEVFFRGYMQSELSARWGPRGGVTATAVAFALLHLDWLHVALALALGLYLGFVTERAGSALPAIACHIVNNTLFTVVTATVGAVTAVRPNVILVAVGLSVFAVSVLWLHRTLPPPAPVPPAAGP
jgi:membrane protease YdiL (CAAX protease family)